MRELTQFYSRNLITVSILSIFLSSGPVLGGFWGISSADEQVDAVPPPPPPVPSVKLKPGVFHQRIAVGIVNMNTEVTRGNNGVLGYSIGRNISGNLGLNFGIGVFRGNFKEEYTFGTWETEGWYFPAQLNLQYNLNLLNVDFTFFGGPNYLYGTAEDRFDYTSTEFRSPSTVNLYGGQLGIGALKKLFGVFDLSGLLMIQSVQGTVAYPDFTFNVSNSNFIHIFIDLIYSPVGVGLSFIYQRDFAGNGSATTVQVGYNF